MLLLQCNDHSLLLGVPGLQVGVVVEIDGLDIGVAGGVTGGQQHVTRKSESLVRTLSTSLR